MLKPQQFIEQMQHLAFYGLSGSGKGYAYDVLKALQAVRPKLRIAPVHPSATALGGFQAQPSATRYTPPPDSAVVVLKPAAAALALEDAAQAGIKTIWLVQNAASRQNLARAEALGLTVLHGCPILHCAGQPFPHSMHRAIAKMFGNI